MYLWLNPGIYLHEPSCIEISSVARIILRHNIYAMRHVEILRGYDPKAGISVATLEYEYRAGYETPEHAHGSDQVVYATSGVMEVSSGQNIWWIPPHFALWISAKTFHRTRMTGAVS